jgi:hypothetical protein
LILVSKVPVGNTENYRASRSQPADFSALPVRKKLRLFLRQSRTNLLSKSTSLMLFSSADFDVFQGTETHPQSATCKCGTRDARGKHRASTGTFGTEIKPTPHTALQKDLSPRTHWACVVLREGSVRP